MIIVAVYDLSLTCMVHVCMVHVCMVHANISNYLLSARETREFLVHR